MASIGTVNIHARFDFWHAADASSAGAVGIGDGFWRAKVVIGNPIYFNFTVTANARSGVCVCHEVLQVSCLYRANESVPFPGTAVTTAPPGCRSRFACVLSPSYIIVLAVTQSQTCGVGRARVRRGPWQCGGGTKETQSQLSSVTGRCGLKKERKSDECVSYCYLFRVLS